MVDAKTMENILLGTVSLMAAGSVGFLAYILYERYHQLERVFKEIKAKYSDSTSLDEAKEFYSKLIKAFSLRGGDPKTIMSDDQKSLFEKIEEKINPQIEKEILEAKIKITPRTRLEDISKTYKEVSPYSYK